MATTPVRKHFSYTIKDIHREFKNGKKKEGIPLSEIIPYKTYKKVIEAFFLAVSKKVVYNNFTFMMPYSLGSLVVKAMKFDPKNTAIDFQRTKKYKKVVRFLNRHTWGFMFRFWWNKEHSNFRNRAYYGFKVGGHKYATDLGIGRSGLGKHIKALSEDPEKRAYLRL